MQFIRYIWCGIWASSIYKKWLYKKRVQVFQFQLNERYVWMNEGHIKGNRNRAVKFVDKNVKIYGFSVVIFLLVWLVTCIWVVHWSDVIWGSWRLKSPASQLFISPACSSYQQREPQSYTSLALCAGKAPWHHHASVSIPCHIHLSVDQYFKGNKCSITLAHHTSLNRYCNPCDTVLYQAVF